MLIAPDGEEVAAWEAAEEPGARRHRRGRVGRAWPANWLIITISAWRSSSPEKLAREQGIPTRHVAGLPMYSNGRAPLPISEAEIRLVRESLPMVRERLVPASEMFYENLFAVEPELRALFRPDLQSQGMRFMSTLGTIADLLDSPARTRV